MVDHFVQDLLDRMRPAIHGRHRGAMQRCFRTSDVLQEAAIQLLDEIEKKGAENIQVTQAWLNRIGRGHASRLRIRHAAQKRSAYATEVHVEDRASSCQTPDQVAERRDQWSNMVLCLGKLESDQRTIIHQHDIDGRSFREIAECMGLQEHTVRRRYHASLKELKILINNNDS